MSTEKNQHFKVAKSKPGSSMHFLSFFWLRKLHGTVTTAEERSYSHSIKLYKLKTPRCHSIRGRWVSGWECLIRGAGFLLARRWLRWRIGDTCLSVASCVPCSPPLAVSCTLRGTLPASRHSHPETHRKTNLSSISKISQKIRNPPRFLKAFPPKRPCFPQYPKNNRKYFVQFRYLAWKIRKVLVKYDHRQ